MDAVNSINAYYANARVAVLSNKLFSKDKFNRLAESGSLLDAIKILHETQYGGIVAEVSDAEVLLRAELLLAVKLLKELCINRHAVDFFVCFYNYHNAKVLMKGKYGRKDGLGLCFECGSFSPLDMQNAINKDEYTDFPSFMQQALSAIDEEFASGNRSPRLIDVTLDKAMLQDMQASARKSGISQLKKYFTFTVDMGNLMLLFRCKKHGLAVERYLSEIASGGSLEATTLSELYGKDSAGIISYFYLHEYQPFVRLCAEEPHNSKLQEVQQYISIKKAEIIGSNSSQETVIPLLVYYTAKVAEIDMIRYILSCVKYGTDKDTIKDRINKHYD